jgi:DNA invertase Pin-like site-specific DNA recombinase
MSSPIDLAQAKVQPAHLARKALVYIRQSSPKQVRENVGSQFNQRALVDRARALGWPPERIDVLDGDLGQSGAATAGRQAFQALTAAVALGQVGIVLGWEVSRLARNNADWYQLLDLAALFGTLMADAEGVYDPRAYNDRLLLGLKGTMSEAELHMLRERLTAGRLSRVRRGEYVQRLPTGLVRLADGRVEQDPDVQVRQAIELVFTQFAALGSCQRVMRYFKQQGLRLPRRQTGGLQRGELLWRKPAADAIYEILQNPAYAGAFVYGRRPTDPTRRRPGRPTTGVVRKPLAEWTSIHPDAYPAYISWEQYLANRARLADNSRRYAERCSRGAPRQGAALLQGLATCGQCGRVMKVVYKQPGVRYACYGLSKAFGEPACAHLDGASIETFVVSAFFQALEPAQLDVLAEVLTERQREHERLAQWHRQQVVRARYEAELARRRYTAVDPENRLVAAELERHWEAALRTLREAEEAAAHFAGRPVEPDLPPALRERLAYLSQALPAFWAGKELSNELRKRLLRSLMARVILKRIAPDRVQVRIVWVSGHFSEGVVIPPIHRQAAVTGYETMVTRIEALWREGRTDAAIAEALTAEGFRSARSSRVSTATILKIRRRYHWVSRYHVHRRAVRLDGRWTVHGLAQALGVDRNWLYRRIARGTLVAPVLIRTEPYGAYLIEDDPLLIERLRREAQRLHPQAQSQT